MDSRDFVDIKDFSNESVLGLALRLEASKTFQETLMREVELDEIWRRLDTAIRERGDDDTQEVRVLKEMFTLVWQAHDLAGDGKLLEAAARLRAALTLHTVLSQQTAEPGVARMFGA